MSQQPGIPVIDVPDIGSLAQLAEHYDRSILHEVSREGEAFWVIDESGQFRYALGAPEAVWEHAREVERAPAQAAPSTYGYPATEAHGDLAPRASEDPEPSALEVPAREAQGSLTHDWHTEELDLNGLIDRGRPATA
jgi:hypothetical protein